MLTITRKKDNRVVKCILHRVADIPGGVGVSVANLGGAVLHEGTPIGLGANGLYKVVKTAKLYATATGSDTTLKVVKGHHFAAGDYITSGDNNGQLIVSIDKSNAEYDTITVKTTIGASLATGACLTETTGVNMTAAVAPVAIVGESYDVIPGENLFVNAWVIGVVKESVAPVVNDTIKSALKGVIFV